MPEKIREENVLSEYKTNMTRYAIYVTRRRAMPDYRDGLKPSQRRILYCMLAFNKAIDNTIKTSSVVGRCMETLHPHGDCLRAQTRLYGLNGNIYTIEQLYNANANLEILALDTRTNTIVPAVAHSFRIGQYTNKVYNIILSNGSKISCTGNHPIYTVNDGWVKAEDISINDILYSKFIRYRDCCHTKLDNDSFSISDIQIEEVDNEPMYDFTVDNFENMLIPMIPENETELSYAPFICVHNSSLNATIKNMLNWFEINVPMITGQGNWGDFSGSPQAAPRYTECKLSRFAMEAVLKDITESKQSVDWAPSYDDRNMEPEFLPAAVPLLLIEGSFGIAVGARTDVPTHNLNEVIDTTIALIKDENAPVCLVPDTCMPCEIFKTDFQSINNKGYGSYKVRGIINIEEYKGKPALIIKSVPDLTFLDTIIDKIEDLVSSNKIIQIHDTIEESTTTEMRYVIVLKKGADPNYVREVIYKNTNMEQSCRVNIEVLDGIHPLRMSYRGYLLAFIEFRKDTKFRMYCNKLQQVQTKIHERDAYIKVLKSGEIDNIIQMIKNQTTVDDDYVVEYLVKKLDITDLQAKFIMGANLKKLSLGYLNKYIEEANQLEAIKAEYMRKIIDKNAIVEEIIEELKYFKKTYGKPRNAKIVAAKSASDIPAGDFKIVITENNFIKKVPINDSIGSFRNDNPKRIIKAENRENILLFDVAGRVFKLPVSKIPFTDRNSNGTDIRILIKGCTSDINTVMYEPIIKEMSEKLNKSYMITITTNGNIKKMDLEDFLTVPPSGITFIKLDEGENVQDVMVVNNKTDIIVYSGKEALRLNTNSIPHFKRNARGSKSMATTNTIDGMSIIKHDTTDIIVITNKGYINRFDAVAMPTLDRGMQGSKVIKLTRDDSIHTMYGVNAKDGIRIITKNGKMEIPVSDIVSGSSISAGQKMINTKGDVIIRCDIIKNRA